MSITTARDWVKSDLPASQLTALLRSTIGG